ncbi:MAG: deoxyribonuclease IV [Candidatus Poribacteria bacterium]|nr:deoxyribonuclease IV [Candidatus Poribacteria bacterium]
MLGAHVSVAGGLHKAFSNGHKLGCDAIQIFVTNPNRWSGSALSSEQVESFRKIHKQTNIQQVIVHDIHLTNLASPKAETRDKSIQAFAWQLGLVEQLGLEYFVTHLGSHLGAGEPEGLGVLSQSLNQILDESRSATVLLETTAGQGRNLGYRFEHLQQIISQSSQPDRLGVCFDTCHVFAAGYDLRTEEDYYRTFNQFDQIVGLSQIKAFHLNDAKSGFGSRVDRHDHIGQGNIGLTAFELLVNDPRFQGRPMIIETPEMNKMHDRNLKTLRQLRSPMALDES